MVAPFLLDHPAVASLYPKDVIERARKLNKVRRPRCAGCRVLASPTRTLEHTPARTQCLLRRALKDSLRACRAAARHENTQCCNPWLHGVLWAPLPPAVP